MYKKLFRPILFSFRPELIHNFSFLSIKILFKIPFIKFLSKKLFQLHNKNLEINIIGKTFKNRIGLAAGFDKNAELLHEMEYFGFSHVEVGTITPLPQDGNPKPRLFRLPKDKSLINRMGFNNDGVDKIAARIKSYKGKIVVGANIGKNKVTPNDRAVDDYLICFKKLREDVDYFVINISSPNTPNLRKLQSKDSLSVILGKIQIENNSQKNLVPIFIKIAGARPYYDTALAVKAGADVVVLDGMQGGTAATQEVFIENVGQPTLACIRPAVDALQDLDVHRKVQLVISGGIRNGADVAKALALGADAVSIGSAAMIAIGDNDPKWENDYKKLGTTAGAYDDWHEGNDPAGISTQNPKLMKRLDPKKAGKKLTNYLKVMTLEAQTLARACGKNSLHNLEPEDLCALTVEAAAMARVPLAGSNWIPGIKEKK